jgi:lipopolysaccharide cholinephosphotransferase
MKHIIKDKEYYMYTKTNKKVPIKKLQLEILEIMDEIDRICRKNKIPYALHAGSALGANNYEGFIPWDDDIDVAIKKVDYKRFIKALQTDLEDDFYFQSYVTDKRYNNLIPNMKIRKKNTYLEEVNVLLKNRCKSGTGIFVDVIWLGNVSENKFIDQLNRTGIKILMPFIVLFDNLHLNPIPLKSLVESHANKYSDINKKSKYCSQTIAIPWEKFLKEPIFLKTDVFPFKDCNFEGRKYMTYNNPEPILKAWYGSDCLKRWNGHEWTETYPEHKRMAKHVKDIKFSDEL